MIFDFHSIGLYAMILDKIIAHKKLEVDIQKKHTPLDEIKENLSENLPSSLFKGGKIKFLSTLTDEF